MVYSIVYLSLRRNFPIKTFKWQNTFTKTLCQRFPLQSSSVISFSTTSNNRCKSKHSSSDGKSLVDSIIAQAKKGKISVNEIKALATTVISEAQYKNYKDGPQKVQRIIFSGLIPMFGIPVMSLFVGHASYCCAHAQLACGATILSFLGGSNWYEAITEKNTTYEKLTWCIMPQLIGWTSLLLPIPLGILTASIGFCLSLLHDVLMTNYPPWLKSLRLIATGGVLISFALMLIFYIIL